MILGIDEVGRGPWAGPLVIGAVVLGEDIPGLTDSKKLTASKREALDTEIRDKALAYGLGWVSASEIDEIGLSKALKLATVRAVEKIKTPYHEIIIDGTINFLAGTSKESYVTTLPKADLLIPAVSAASIIAKVARDTFMAEQDKLHPGYGFSSHVGYGTAKHQAALQQFGITPLHRRSFAPIKKLLGASPETNAHNTSLTSTQVGAQAEERAARYLEQAGHVLLERNWKTKYCEIDIVSLHNETLFCVEVKYRSSALQGGGLEAITPKKLSQMTKAAELYRTTHAAVGTIPVRLAVVSVSPNGIDSFLELS